MSIRLYDWVIEQHSECQWKVWEGRRLLAIVKYTEKTGGTVTWGFLSAITMPLVIAKIRESLPKAA